MLVSSPRGGRDWRWKLVRTELSLSRAEHRKKELTPFSGDSMPLLLGLQDPLLPALSDCDSADWSLERPETEVGGMITEPRDPRLKPALSLERLLRKSNALRVFFNACVKGIFLLKFYHLPFHNHGLLCYSSTMSKCRFFVLFSKSFKTALVLKVHLLALFSPPCGISLSLRDPTIARASTKHSCWDKTSVLACISHEDYYSVQFSRSVVSDSLRPHESQHVRPPCPSPTPGVYTNSCPSSQ